MRRGGDTSIGRGGTLVSVGSIPTPRSDLVLRPLMRPDARAEGYFAFNECCTTFRHQVLGTDFIRCDGRGYFS